jgi:MSHA biogenesis protein MshL
MEPKTRNWTSTSGLVAAVAFHDGDAGTARPGSAQPGLPPLAVSQLEEGRRSEDMNQTMSLSFAEPISIRELLLLLVRDTNLSVVLDPGVEGTFSGDLKNVTLRQALDLVLGPHGFLATFQDNIVRVHREQVQTRLFNINYVATRRSGTRTGRRDGRGFYGAGIPAA